MQRMLTVLVALVLLGGGAALTQSDGWFNRWTPEPQSGEEEAVLPWQQGKEHWLVVVVDFDDATTQSTGLGVEQASTLVEGEITDYLSLMAGDDSVNFTVVPVPIRAASPSTLYGADSAAGRDFAADGTFMPSQLVAEVISAIEDDVNWDAHDLDDDGVVDRFLVLHTSRGQESGAGGPDRIWSHFTHLMEPVEVGSNVQVAHYAMATLRGGTGATGTILHEMLHQLGAIDLYPVHDPAWSGTWQGVGDWDIMASGNWNGAGVWPALPTAASMERIGLDTSVNVDLDFPVQREGACLGPTLELSPRHEGGNALRIDLTKEQRVFIELKGGNTYDDRLPGQGVLVTLLDEAAGDPEENEVNVDPGRPWLKVIEADGDDGLLNGQDDGSAGDAFQLGDTFGAEGVEIRDHRGLKVPWTAEIVQGTDGNGTAVAFSAPNCGQGLSLDVPAYGLRVTANEGLFITLNNMDAPCTLQGSLRMDFGGMVTFPSTLLDEGEHRVELEPQSALTGDLVDRLSGTLTCGGTDMDLDVPVTVLNRRPEGGTHEATIAVSDKDTVSIDLLSSGHGSSTYTVLIEGPLSRVADAPARVTLDNDLVTLSLNIDPSGLLEDGMLVRGEVHLVDLDGGRTVIPVTLTAEDEISGLDQLRQPELALGVCFMLVGLSLLWPRNTGEKTTASPSAVDQTPTSDVRMDPWGRPLDAHDGVGQVDQGVHVEPPTIDR